MILFEKQIADARFLFNVQNANSSEVSQEIDQSGRLIRVDEASVKGPQGWKRSSVNIALFDKAIHLISISDYKVERSIRLGEYRLSEHSEKGYFVNIQHGSGFRWTFTLTSLTSYLCFVRELFCCGSLLALQASSLSIISSISSEEATLHTALNSNDEYLSAQEGADTDDDTILSPIKSTTVTPGK